MWFFITCAVVCGGLILIYIFRSRRNGEKIITLGFISNLISYIALILSIWSIQNKDGSVISMTDSTSGSIISVNGNASGKITSVVGDVTESTIYNNYVMPDEISLASAGRKLVLKDYKSAAEIYLQVLIDDPENEIALCNLGYLFANGLGTEVDFQQALNYYDQAISCGNSQALCNELALCLENDISTDRMVGLIQRGLSIGNEEICKFVAASMQDDESITENDALEFCKEIQEISLNMLWSWEKGESIKVYSHPSSTSRLRYIYVGSGFESTDTYTTVYYIYQIEKLFCPYVHLLQAGFAEI